MRAWQTGQRAHSGMAWLAGTHYSSLSLLLFCVCHRIYSLTLEFQGESQLERRRTAAELLRFFDRNGDGLIDRLEFELGCLLVQQSEGDDFVEKKLELLFAVDDSCGPVAIKRGEWCG